MNKISGDSIIPEGSEDYTEDDFLDTDAKAHATRDVALARSAIATSARARGLAEIKANAKRF